MKQQEINKLLDQYRLGTISDENKRKLEQISIADDFVFEALQGMNAANDAGASKSMDNLRERLENRVSSSKTKRLPIWIPSAAAAILLIVGAMWIFNNDSDSINSNKEFATAIPEKKIEEESASLESNEKPTPPQSTSVLSDKDIPTRNTSSNNSLEEKEEEIVSSPAPESSDYIASSSPSAGSVEYEFNETQDDSEIPNSEIVEEDMSEFQGDLNTEYSPERIQEEPAMKAKKTTASHAADNVIRKEMKTMIPSPAANDQAGYSESIGKNYEGTITDSYGEILTGANVQVIGTEIYAVSDFDGKVKLENVDIENARLKVSYIGYKDAEIPLTDNFRVQLYEGSSLSEVVVAKAESINAKPRIGWKEFEKLIKQKIEPTTSGDPIQIDFTVDKGGIPTSFQVISGKDDPRTPILLDLIQNSGRWTTGKGSVIY